MEFCEVDVSGDIGLLLIFLLVLQFLVVLLLTVILLRLLLSPLVHVEVLLLVVVVGNGALAATGLKGEDLPSHLEGKATVLRRDE
jgi:hypothetical protein